MTYVDCNKCRVNAFLDELCDPAFCSKFAKEGNSDDFTEAIEEVIHCKDCKYYSCGTIEGKHLCMSVKYRFTPTAEDEWCSRAERKKNEKIEQIANA